MSALPRWTALIVAFSGALVATAALAGPVGSAGRPIPRPTDCRTAGYLVRTVEDGDPARLVRFDLTAPQVRTRVTDLPYRLTALGWSAASTSLYGLARPLSGGPRTVLRIDPSGAYTDHGPIRAGQVPLPADGFASVTAGTVWRDHWYLLEDNLVYDVNVNPASPDYLSITYATALTFPFFVGDWDIDPATGRLVAIMLIDHQPTLLRADPGSGILESRTPIAGLPDYGTYGAVWVSADGAILTTNNTTGDLYRIVPAKTGLAATVTRPGSPSISLDAATCHP